MQRTNFLGWIRVTGLVAGTLFSGIGRTENAPASLVATGVQLWGQNCVRCHNAPPPTAFTDMEWKLITHHMQVNANLAAEEIQAILEFLKASN